MHCLWLSESAVEATNMYVARLVATAVSELKAAILTVERFPITGGQVLTQIFSSSEVAGVLKSKIK